LGYPLVIKPVGEALGRGAVANIVDSAHFVKSLQHVRDELGYRKILVEKYIVGKEYRVYVLGNEVVGSIERTIPSVTGDGVSDVEELIRKKNEDRKNNLYLCKHPINIDDEILGNLDKIGYTLRSVPRASEFVLLRNKPSPVAGGESIEVSDILPEVVKKQAIKAVGCIPGLEFAGLDMICNFDDLSNPGCIIEINHMPMYDNVVFPVYGEPRDIPSALLDYYFPESIINRNNQRNLYLDLKSISNYIQEGMIKELIVEPAPEKELLCSKIMLYGKVHRVGYRSWIKKKAIANKIHGHAINHKDGSIEVLVAGSDQKVVDQFIALCKEGPKKAKVCDVTVEEYTGPIKIGFHIIEEKKYDEQRKKLKKEINDLQFYEKELKENKHKLVKIEMKHRNIMRKYKAIINSRSWRYTELLRKTFSKLHGRK
jgi:cyanophycin synthetase